MVRLKNRDRNEYFEVWNYRVFFQPVGNGFDGTFALQSDSPVHIPQGPLVNTLDLLVPNAMRLAEYVHRQRNHRRKAPPGEDRPAYFLHLAEVAWLLLDSGSRDDELIAAAFLHDIIEDCGYDEGRLAQAIGNRRVAALVAAVSEPDKRQSWEDRQQHYRERLSALNDPALLALSCADKTSNLTDMNRLMARGHAVDSFTRRGFDAQRAKFEALDRLFVDRVPERLHQRFQRALAEFRERGRLSTEAPSRRS